jgi:hypothetical protein
MGSRSMRTSSWLTGTVLVTFSVTTYLRRRAHPVFYVNRLGPVCQRIPAAAIEGPAARQPRSLLLSGNLIRRILGVLLFARAA